MATPNRMYSSGGSSLYESSAYRTSNHTTSASRLGSYNPFRSQLNSVAGSSSLGRGASIGSHSASLSRGGGTGGGVLRENTPSFADCFSGMESHYLALGESPGAQSPTPMRTRQQHQPYSPVPGHHEAPPLTGQQHAGVPTTTHTQLSDIAGVGQGDFSYNSLQLSTEGSQPPGTPPPRLEREEYVNHTAGGMFGQTPGSSTAKKGSRPTDSQMATPQRPPLHPNLSPIPGPGASSSYMSPIPQQSRPGSGVLSPPTSVAAAVAAGFVSPGHGRAAAVTYTEYRQHQQQRPEEVSGSSTPPSVSGGGGGGPESQSQLLPHVDTPEVTQENFQRSMREAEEEALLASGVSQGAGVGDLSRQQYSRQEQAHPTRSASNGSAGVGSTELGTHTAAPSTEPAPQAPHGVYSMGVKHNATSGVQMMLPSSSPTAAGRVELGHSVEHFLATSTEGQRSALIALLTELNRSPGQSPATQDYAAPFSNQAHSTTTPEAVAWQQIGSQRPIDGSFGDRQDTSGKSDSLLFPRDPLSTIAPDFGYYEPDSASVYTRQGPGASRLSSTAPSLLPKRWRTEYHSAMLSTTAGTESPGNSISKLAGRSPSLHPAYHPDFLTSSPFGTSTSRRMRM